MTSHEDLRLPHDALEVARELCGQVLDDFGLEVGRRPGAPFRSLWDAFAFGARYALACGERRALGESVGVRVSGHDEEELRALLAEIQEKGTPRERLALVETLNSCAAWGLGELERTARLPDGRYDLRNARARIGAGGVRCSLCGAQNPLQAEKCAFCGAFLDD